MSATERRWAAGAVVACAAGIVAATTDALTCLARVLLPEIALLIALVCAAAIVVARPASLATWSRGRYVALAMSLSLLVLVSSARPIGLDERRLGYDGKASFAANPELLHAELQKANDEIRLRIEQEDTWFHLKFLLVGAMLAAFGGAFTFGRAREHVPLTAAAVSPETCTLLALALVVALAIDIHLRNNIVVIQQLGLWIANYAEPAMSATPSAFAPWEQFLRRPGLGMHADELYGFIFYPHLHFLTMVLYALYLGCFQTLAVQTFSTPERPQPYALLAAGFVLVHASLAVFAWVGHFVPAAFVTNVIPFAACQRTGASAASAYWFLTLLIFGVNAPFFGRFVQLARKAAT